MGYERYDIFPKVLYQWQVVYMSDQAGSDIVLYMILKIFQDKLKKNIISVFLTF